MSAPCLYFSGTLKVTNEDDITGNACAMFTSGFCTKLLRFLACRYLLEAIMSAPCLYFSGTLKVTSEDDITGNVCAMFTRGLLYKVALIFSLSVLVMSVVELGLMSVLYFRICHL